ncbi:MAG: methyltransferase domain-containing protein [Candidatus Heimdallarchaeota archaeon]|nr:MAG: methyltransferase domain-containing protein [Candidatus Heimdallarchaeota archaeon]
MSREPGQRLIVKDRINSEEDAHYFNEMYEDQMEWTVSTRKRLYRKMELFHAKTILEVGSGTGAILREIQTINPRARLVGLDWNLFALKFSQVESLSPNSICGNGELLPFSDNNFDITLCNYFLMWVKEPLAVLKEMRRVTRIGGWIACLAEPDYGGRLDYPASEQWEELLLESLSAHDPYIGRKLRSLFHKADLQVEVGLQSSVLSPDIVMDLYKAEFDKLAHFLGENSAKLAKLKYILETYSPADRFSFMPVFFGIARKI